MQATIQAACPTAIIEELNAVPAGDVIDHPVLQSAKQLLPVEAKQAWTDVAQLTGQGFVPLTLALAAKIKPINPTSV